VLRLEWKTAVCSFSTPVTILPITNLCAEKVAELRNPILLIGLTSIELIIDSIGSRRREQQVGVFSDQRSRSTQVLAALAFYSHERRFSARRRSLRMIRTLSTNRPEFGPPDYQGLFLACARKKCNVGHSARSIQRRRAF